jgi:hypothetical protein
MAIIHKAVVYTIYLSMEFAQCTGILGHNATFHESIGHRESSGSKVRAVGSLQ